MSRHALLMGIAHLLGFYADLRPAELMSLKAAQITQPASQSRGTLGLLLPPSGHMRAPKTGQLDESVLVDWKDVPALGRAMDARLKTLQATASFWPFSRTELEAGFKADVERGGLAVLSPHLYSLRHGGASWDLVTGRRSLPEIKGRGRWFADTSVRRYTKSARALKEEQRIAPEFRRYGDRIWQRLNAILDGQACPSPPRGIKRQLDVLTRPA